MSQVMRIKYFDDTDTALIKFTYNFNWLLNFKVSFGLLENQVVYKSEP